MASTAVHRRHQPLERDIETSGGRLRTKSITGKRKSRTGEQPGDDGYIDARSSRKILAIAQDLADEDALERKAVARPVSNAFDFGSRFAGEDVLEDADGNKYDEEEEWMPDEEEEVDPADLDPEELAMFKKFLPEGDEFVTGKDSIANLSTTGIRPSAQHLEDDGDDDAAAADEDGQTTNLADLILQRIAEKEAQDEARAAGNLPANQQIFGGGAPDDAVEIPAKVADTFTKVGQLLSRYKSGPLPKPFKVLPTLPQWPDLLAITRPETWTPNAIYRATKIFISAPTATGQHFLNTVLLDRVQEDIRETKKLNVHLYNSLKATFYRPAAFFKGFLFPLIESGCTLREAHIIASVLAKIKIPVLHSAAALLRLCEICAEQTSTINSEAAGSANIFIKTLLSKKYALPYKVVDGLVFHFVRFRATKDTNNNYNHNQLEKNKDEALAAKEAKLPVLWHQCLLVFAQTYRNEITEDQREALLDLILVRGHKDIGPEVRRELLAGRSRAALGNGDDITASGGGGGMDIDALGNAALTGDVSYNNNNNNNDHVRDDGDDTMDIA